MALNNTGSDPLMGTNSMGGANIANNLGGVAQGFMDLMQPTFQRQQQQLANTLGGIGALQGSPYANQSVQLAGQQGANIAQLMSPIYQQQQQQQYQSPLDLANLTGQLPGSTGTYNPQSGWSWTGGPTETIGGQAQTTISPYQQQLINATNNQTQTQFWQNIAQLLWPSISGMLGGGGLPSGGSNIISQITGGGNTGNLGSVLG